jgi:hypothetical protein
MQWLKILALPIIQVAFYIASLWQIVKDVFIRLALKAV